MSLPATIPWRLTALPGDYYLRLPVLDHRALLRSLDDTLVMVDGADPAHWPELQDLEPEETGPGSCPMVVRTVVCVERMRLLDWLTDFLPLMTTDERSHPAADADIVGVCYWGGENERWRLRRVCIGRYSRIEELDDTSELDSTGAFRDWLLVQGNQFQALTLYRYGWVDYNTTEVARLLPFLHRWLAQQEDALLAQHPGHPITAGSLDARRVLQEIAQGTANVRYGVAWDYLWHLAQGSLERVGSQVVKV